LSPSGALDPRALALANALVGNHPGTAAIELVLYGARLRVIGGPVRVALAGAEFPLHVDDRPRPHHTSFLVPDGAQISIAHARAGTAAILAIEGGIAVPTALGARSLHVRAELGGLEGRPLASGSRVPLARMASSRPETTADPVPIRIGAPIRILPGPQKDAFSEATWESFIAAAFRVTSDVDRMGYRLEGPRIRARNGHNIISDGVVRGCIQVPGSGNPIVMLAEHQTTGGYPKIATVITADLPLLVQRRPGDTIRFGVVSIDDARDALLAYHRDIAESAARTRQVTPAFGWLAQASLINLAGVAISADDPASWSLLACERDAITPSVASQAAIGLSPVAGLSLSASSVSAGRISAAGRGGLK
jgi:biotin-dependent carboxylase-like uncharacterized protein